MNRTSGDSLKIPDLGLVATEIRESGFSCTRCGGCCRQDTPDSNQVMVTAADLRAIGEVSGLCREDFCDPFPGEIPIGENLTCTFNWELKRTGTGCMFLSDSCCGIYPVRPWICRTYPFMLHEGNLEVFPCPGIGRYISEEDAREMAGLLIERYQAEIVEEKTIRTVLAAAKLSGEGHFVADSEGITPLRGK